MKGSQLDHLKYKLTVLHHEMANARKAYENSCARAATELEQLNKCQFEIESLVPEIELLQDVEDQFNKIA